jgi:hypothetical protein
MDVKSGGLLVDQKAAMMVKRWVDWKGCCLAVPKGKAAWKRSWVRTWL